MDRDKGLRRTTAITAALVAASIAGTLGVGIAAHSADSTESGSTTTPAVTGNNRPTDSPTLSSGDDDSGQATSGGS